MSEVVALCRTDIEEIKVALLPMAVRDERDMDLKQKAKWLFAKSKISTRRASLDSLKLTLDPFLAHPLISAINVTDNTQVGWMRGMNESENVPQSNCEWAEVIGRMCPV